MKVISLISFNSLHAVVIIVMLQRTTMYTMDDGDKNYSYSALGDNGLSAPTIDKGNRSLSSGENKWADSKEDIGHQSIKPESYENKAQTRISEKREMAKLKQPLDMNIVTENLNPSKPIHPDDATSSFKSLETIESDTTAPPASDNRLLNSVYQLEAKKKRSKKHVTKLRRFYKKQNAIYVRRSRPKGCRKSKWHLSFLGYMTMPINSKRNKLHVKRKYSLPTNDQFQEERTELKKIIREVGCVTIRDDDETQNSTEEPNEQDLAQINENYDSFPSCLKSHLEELENTPNKSGKIQKAGVITCSYRYDKRNNAGCADGTVDNGADEDKSLENDGENEETENNKEEISRKLHSEHDDSDNDSSEALSKHPHVLYVDVLDLQKALQIAYALKIRKLFGDNQHFDGIVDNQCYYYYNKKYKVQKIMYLKKMPYALLNEIYDLPLALQERGFDSVLNTDMTVRTGEEPAELPKLSEQDFLPTNSIFWRLRIARQIIYAALLLAKRNVSISNFDSSNVVFLDKYNVRLTNIEKLRTITDDKETNEPFIRPETDLDFVYKFTNGEVITVPLTSATGEEYKFFFQSVMIVVKKILMHDPDAKITKKLESLVDKCVEKPFKKEILEDNKQNAKEMNNDQQPEDKTVEADLIRLYNTLIALNKYIYSLFNKKAAKNVKDIPKCSSGWFNSFKAKFIPFARSKHKTLSGLLLEMSLYYKRCKDASDEYPDDPQNNYEVKLCEEAAASETDIKHISSLFNISQDEVNESLNINPDEDLTEEQPTESDERLLKIPEPTELTDKYKESLQNKEQTNYSGVYALEGKNNKINI